MSSTQVLHSAPHLLQLGIALVEKKHLSVCGAKSSEDVQVASDKVEYLNKIKQKLESTLDKPEFSVEKAKRTRAVDENEGQDLVAWIQA